ncbi:hypothetical protein [Luteimonas sp. A478]
MRISLGCLLWQQLLVRQIRSYGPNLLLVLPATDRSVELARAVCQAGACWVTKGAIFDNLAPKDPLVGRLRTPAEIIQAASRSGPLEQPVISFPELIVGDGPSFVKVKFLGQARFFSVMEPLLALRHAPKLLSVSSWLGARTYQLRPITLGPHQESDILHSTLRDLLRPIEREAWLNPRDWRAGNSLAAKTEDGFHASLREDCRDLESILRTMLLHKVGCERDIQRLIEALNEYGKGSLLVTSVNTQQSG